MGLFRRVWPDKFPERDNTVVVTDLKYLTLLAAGNLSDNPHVYAIFSTLHDAEMEVDTSIRVNDRISVEDVSYDDKWVLCKTDPNYKEDVIQEKFMELLCDMSKTESDDMADLLKTLGD